MKKHVLLFIILADALSFSCFAQPKESFLVNTKVENMKSLSDRMAKNEFVIVSYHVEEIRSLKLGSSITTYDVPDLSLVNTNDLGENNTRIIIPKYARAKVAVMNRELLNTSFAVVSNNQIETDLSLSEIKRTHIKINILRTYERVLERGYLTVEMLKKVGDWRYFEGDLDIAAKWYAELYCMTTDLETTFYYRYAESLKSIGQIEKAEEMMDLFEKGSKNVGL